MKRLSSHIDHKVLHTKLRRDIRNRGKYIEFKIDQVTKQLVKSIGIPVDPEPIKKGPVDACYITGRCKSVFSVNGLRLSRHLFRKFSDMGYLAGIGRSS
jgi:ribosomal protein S14